jgi:hypothetical protein
MHEETSLPYISGIGRVNYTIRLLMGILVAIVLYGLIVIALMNDARSSSSAFFVPLLVASFIVNFIGLPYVLAKYVFIPRLKNAGFEGPVMWLMVVLCIFPPTAFFVWIALLFVPTRFVRDR